MPPPPPHVQVYAGGRWTLEKLHAAMSIAKPHTYRARDSKARDSKERCAKERGSKARGVKVHTAEAGCVLTWRLPCEGGHGKAKATNTACTQLVQVRKFCDHRNTSVWHNSAYATLRRTDAELIQFNRRLGRPVAEYDLGQVQVPGCRAQAIVELVEGEGVMRVPVRTGTRGRRTTMRPILYAHMFLTTASCDARRRTPEAWTCGSAPL